jgi:hypothetical protein
MTRQCAPRTRSRATRVCPGALASARLRAVFSPSVASALPENYSGRGRIHRGTAVTYMSACSPKVTPTLDRIARPSPLSNYFDITNYQLQFVLLWGGPYIAITIKFSIDSSSIRLLPDDYHILFLSRHIFKMIAK